MDVGDQSLMGNDCPPEYLEPVSGFAICVGLPEISEARRVFDALAEDGTVKMPFEKTFWSPGFGMVKDRFGQPWMIDTMTQEQAAA